MQHAHVHHSKFVYAIILLSISHLTMGENRIWLNFPRLLTHQIIWFKSNLLHLYWLISTQITAWKILYLADVVTRPTNGSTIVTKPDVRCSPGLVDPNAINSIHSRIAQKHVPASQWTGIARISIGICLTIRRVAMATAAVPMVTVVGETINNGRAAKDNVVRAVTGQFAVLQLI